MAKSTIGLIFTSAPPTLDSGRMEHPAVIQDVEVRQKKCDIRIDVDGYSVKDVKVFKRSSTKKQSLMAELNQVPWGPPTTPEETWADWKERWNSVSGEGSEYFEFNEDNSTLEDKFKSKGGSFEDFEFLIWIYSYDNNGNKIPKWVDPGIKNTYR